ncbi:MAG: hypothetical protein OEZ68_18975 [Gammaproteobacteria bacterium]|nr:hypothetical protein [Gammaproteobacteria bacterium]MDH5802891.1 hypothetical protein [Gammaproteobacteria bacterium]
MKLQYLSNDKYNQLVFKSIVGDTGYSTELFISDHGFPSIGYNFNLKDPVVLRQVLFAMGFDISGAVLSGEAAVAEKYYIELIFSAFQIVSCKDAASLKRITNNILMTRAQDERYDPDFVRLQHFVAEKPKGMITSLASIISYYEEQLDRWLESFENMSPQLSLKSAERSVLFSLAYQGLIGMEQDGKTPKFSALGQALLQQNRAECWYLIRYTAFIGDQIGNRIIKKRYFESELFSLYEEGETAISLAPSRCKAIYKMFLDNKQKILNHETMYAAQIRAASKHYDSLGVKIRTLEQSFDLVYTHIREMKSLNSNFIRTSLEKVPTLVPMNFVARNTQAV